MTRPSEELAALPLAGENPGEVSPEFIRECVEFFAEVVQVFGVPRSVGQIYGVLFASPRPLSFTDIAESLEISRGSASQGLQFLRDLGAVRLYQARESRAEMGDGRSEMGAEDGGRSTGLGNLRPEGGDRMAVEGRRGGSRRELYVPELKLRTLVAGVLREKVDPIVSGGAARVKRLRSLAETTPTAAGRKFSGERMKKLENWRRQMGLLLPLLKTILGPGQT